MYNVKVIQIVIAFLYVSVRFCTWVCSYHLLVSQLFNFMFILYSFAIFLAPHRDKWQIV